MEFSSEVIRDVSDSLTSEESDIGAPEVVLLSWAALTDGGADATYAVCSSDTDGTRWRVLGADSTSVFILEAASPEPAWYLGYPYDEPGGITRAVVLPHSALEELRLLAVRDVSTAHASSYTLRARWEVVVAGETFAVPASSGSRHELYARAESFLGDLRRLTALA